MRVVFISICYYLSSILLHIADVLPWLQSLQQQKPPFPNRSFNYSRFQIFPVFINRYGNHTVLLHKIVLVAQLRRIFMLGDAHLNLLRIF